MPDFLWGLQMMVVGMGVVFGLLLALMGLLIVIGRLDRRGESEPGSEPAPDEDEDQPDAAASGPAAPVVRIVADGLDEGQLAAIAVAVMTHAEVRRRSASPEARAHAPGSQLFASRWVSIGRGLEHISSRRR